MGTHRQFPRVVVGGTRLLPFTRSLFRVDDMERTSSDTTFVIYASDRLLSFWVYLLHEVVSSELAGMLFEKHLVQGVRLAAHVSLQSHLFIVPIATQRGCS